MQDVIHSLSTAFGELKGKVEHLIERITENAKEDDDHRTATRIAVSDLGTRMGILEHRVGDIVPRVHELVTKETKQQAVHEYRSWLMTALYGMAATVASGIGTVAWAIYKSKFGG